MSGEASTRRRGAHAARVTVERVYDEPGPEESPRVLVDRLWPRGLRKDGAPVDEWCRDVAPSTELRRWYGHAPERYGEFVRRYRAELHDPDHVVAYENLRARARQGPMVLLTAVRDVPHSHAHVLAELLNDSRR